MTVKEPLVKCKADLQFGLSNALAGDVSLNLCLVNPIDAGPDKRSTNGYSPEGVSSQRVHIIACIRKGQTGYLGCKKIIIMDS